MSCRRGREGEEKAKGLLHFCQFFSEETGEILSEKWRQEEVGSV